MSLVSTYVLADDGLLYRDPIIRGDGWFICFDDDDPPELVVEKNGRSIREIEPVMKSILTEAAIDATPRSIVNSGERFYGKGDFRASMRCWLAIHKPIPAALMPHRGVKPEKRSCCCVIELCGGKLTQENGRVQQG